MAVLQHITHTAIFTWMLVEGIHLYIKLVKVFSVHKLYITYIVIGWGKALMTAFILPTDPSGPSIIVPSFKLKMLFQFKSSPSF